MFMQVYDWLSSNLLFLWLVVAMFFLILEMGSPGLFFFLAFFFGAIISASSAFVTSSMLVQSVIFLIGSIASFMVLHFWVKRKILKPEEHELSNIYALKTKRAKVLKRITPDQSGTVKVGGEIWSARSQHQEVIEEGEHVSIVSVKGAHLIVKKI